MEFSFARAELHQNRVNINNGVLHTELSAFVTEYGRIKKAEPVRNDFCQVDGVLSAANRTDRENIVFFNGDFHANAVVFGLSLFGMHACHAQFYVVVGIDSHLHSPPQSTTP
jgi:hypothetical protein